MATLNGMKEHCTECGVELELGQIGLCDDCQELVEDEPESQKPDN